VYFHVIYAVSNLKIWFLGEKLPECPVWKASVVTELIITCQCFCIIWISEFCNICGHKTKETSVVHFSLHACSLIHVPTLFIKMLLSSRRHSWLRQLVTWVLRFAPSLRYPQYCLSWSHVGSEHGCSSLLLLLDIHNTAWADPFQLSDEVEVKLRPTVSQPVHLGVRHPSGTRDQFLFSLRFSLDSCRFVIL
jgi:hypothetical protein